jgi:hypothetical protein
MELDSAQSEPNLQSTCFVGKWVRQHPESKLEEATLYLCWAQVRGGVGAQFLLLCLFVEVVSEARSGREKSAWGFNLHDERLAATLAFQGGLRKQQIEGIRTAVKSTAQMDIDDASTNKASLRSLLHREAATTGEIMGCSEHRCRSHVAGASCGVGPENARGQEVG